MTPDPQVVPDLFTHASQARATDPETSKASAKVTRGTVRYRVLAAYGRFAHGLSDDDAGDFAGVRNGAWKRCSELRKLGLIAPTGETKTTLSGGVGRVCKITPEGWQALNGAPYAMRPVAPADTPVTPPSQTAADLRNALVDMGQDDLAEWVGDIAVRGQA